MSDGKVSAAAILLDAERQADEVVAKARETAEQIVAAANKHADEIRGTLRLPAGEAMTIARQREELERQKRLISDDADARIEQMRAAAQAKLQDAVEKLFVELVGES